MSPFPSRAAAIDVAAIRRRFPALAGETVFLENAGGSQVPLAVADAMRRYLLDSYVQLGAGYRLADIADDVVERAHQLVATLMNGAETGTVILGPSCSQLCAMLAGCYADILTPGDEIIITETGHEANINPWTKLADRGAVVKTWPVDSATFTCPLDELKCLITDRTRIVALVHVSNLLGEIVDVAAIADLVHRATDGRARVVVDGVAYAPHRAIDVAAWGVDYYLYSTYKVYGPHMGALWGARDALAELTGPNHFFINRTDVPYKFELGGVNHEGCAGLLALAGYLNFLAGNDGVAPFDRRTVIDAFDVMTACEAPLQQRLVDYLLSRGQLRIIGPAHAEPSRVPTVSFVHESKSSAEIAAAAHAADIGIRNGHMYAYRLCQALGLDPDDGVVRISAVHYNTLAEIDRLIDVLDRVI